MMLFLYGGGVGQGRPPPTFTTGSPKSQTKYAKRVTNMGVTHTPYGTQAIGSETQAVVLVQTQDLVAAQNRTLLLLANKKL